MLGVLQKKTKNKAKKKEQKEPSTNIAELAQLYPVFTDFDSHSYLSHYKYVYTR